MQQTLSVIQISIDQEYQLIERTSRAETRRLHAASRTHLSLFDLDTDVLSKIILAVIHDDIVSRESGMRAWNSHTALMCTCRALKTFIENDPLFWAYVSVRSGPSFASLSLKKSLTLPLHLDVTLPYENLVCCVDRFRIQRMTVRDLLPTVLNAFSKNDMVTDEDVLMTMARRTVAFPAVEELVLGPSTTSPGAEGCR